MAYVLIVTIHFSNLLQIRSPLPHRFPSLEACEAFYDRGRSLRGCPWGWGRAVGTPAQR
jgi:hypothetical protein